MIGAAAPRLRPTGLAARIILFLSLALVPIGVVAFFQTAKLQEETRLRSQLSLVALTEAAAQGEREAILRAQGGAQALGATLAPDLDDSALCNDRLKQYVAASPGYSFAGFLLSEGRFACSTADDPIDVENNPYLQRLLANSVASVWYNPDGAISRRAVIVVAQPYVRNGVQLGFVLLSIPSAMVRHDNGEDIPEYFEDVITITEAGGILSSREGIAKVDAKLPAELDLASLVGGRPQSFAARSNDGETRVFASAPLVPGMVHALGIWNRESAEAQAISVTSLAAALPLLMWGASVIVAFLAVNRLVIRHINRLSHRMRTFARSRQVPATSSAHEMPAELADMESDFLDMAEAILRDEAQQENALREKTILLKEVHHRVKNNLQLISSIMNMQIRQSRNEETRAILHRLQDRVRSLATIHRNLYQTEDLGHVDAGRLISELVEQLSEVSSHDGNSPELRTRVESIEAVPDQAVPLSLLTAEAITNSLKYAGPDANGKTDVTVILRRLKGAMVELEVINTLGPDEEEEADVEPAGLGYKLMRAFATQLGGQLETGEVDGFYRVAVRFQLEDFEPDPTTPTSMPNVPDF